MVRPNGTSVSAAMPSRTQHLKDMAQACRQLAAATADPAVRLDLLLVAEKFERLIHMREWATALPETSTPAPSKPDS
jgi:hypothetical protein